MRPKPATVWTAPDPAGSDAQGFEGLTRIAPRGPQNPVKAEAYTERRDFGRRNAAAGSAVATYI